MSDYSLKTLANNKFIREMDRRTGGGKILKISGLPRERVHGSHLLTGSHHQLPVLVLEGDSLFSTHTILLFPRLSFS